MTGTRMEIKRWVAIAALIAAVISGAAAALAAANGIAATGQHRTHVSGGGERAARRVAG